MLGSLADRVARPWRAQENFASVAILGSAETQPIARAVNLEKPVRGRGRSGGCISIRGAIEVDGEDEVGNMRAGDTRENEWRRR